MLYSCQSVDGAWRKLLLQSEQGRAFRTAKGSAVVVSKRAYKGKSTHGYGATRSPEATIGSSVCSTATYPEEFGLHEAESEDSVGPGNKGGNDKS